MTGWIPVVGVFIVSFMVLRYQKNRFDRRIEELRKQSNDLRLETLTWRNSALELHAAINQLRHGVMLLSVENKFVVFNPAAGYLLNMGDNVHWKDQPFIDLIRFPEMNQAIKAAKNGEGVQKVSVEVPIEDGVRLVKARVTRIETPELDRVLVSLQDETDALLLDQMRREFVANTSHELKTPLAAIKGYAETVELAIEDDPDAAKHFMRQINVECLRLEHLIEDMMQLARAQSGNASLAASNLRLRDVIDQSLSSNRPVALTKSIDLSFESEIGGKSDDATVLADMEATLTIINNLISNAIRYTPNGGKVTVGILDADKFFSVYVDDTGVGISPSEQKRVFERFYRVKGKRHEADLSNDVERTSDRGTGIGLSIVKQLTKALGGEIRLNSVLGVGSRFEVLLPKS